MLLFIVLICIVNAACLYDSVCVQKNTLDCVNGCQSEPCGKCSVKKPSLDQACYLIDCNAQAFCLLYNCTLPNGGCPRVSIDCK